MRKQLTLVMISLLFSFAIKAQLVKGTVMDENNKPLPSATVMLLNAADSSVVKMSASDKSGAFEFEVKNGRYIIGITSVGFNKSYSELFEVSDNTKNIELNAIGMTAQPKSMQGVVVTSRKPLIEQKIDKTVVNVDASITNVGNSALEVLEKSPGITVDKDGNISLKGKQGVIVMIDGRQTYLSGADLANLLRSMNASQMEQVEIMTNPSAKYDAAGNSGIINIKTKKNKQVGYNGTVTLGYGQGRYPKVNEGISFNYRKNKVNLFTSLSHNFRKSFNELTIDRRFRNESTKEIVSYFDQQANVKLKANTYTGKLGVDYYVSKKTTLGFTLNGYLNENQIINFNTNDVKPVNGTNSQLRSLAIVNPDWNNLGSNFNLRHAFDTTGREISFDVDYLQYSTDVLQELRSSYYSNGILNKKPDTLFGETPQDIKIFTAKTDYVKPLNKGAKLELGAKTSFVKTQNDARYDSLINGSLVYDNGRNNNFSYDENVNAAYINYSRPLGKKFTMQLGLRMENTNMKGIQKVKNQQFDTSYVQLFPAAFVQYKLNEKNSFGLSYGRRINRPDYKDLNPFEVLIDPYTIEKGNPGLIPQTSHNIEFSHTYNNFLTTVVNYTRTTDIIQQVFEQISSQNKTFITWDNIATHRQIGISITASKQLNKWWSGSIYTNLASNKFSGVVDNQYVTINTPSFMANVSQQFRWGKGWGAEISGLYINKVVEGVILINSFGKLDMGISKQILKGKGTLRMNVNDLLYTQIINGGSRYNDIDINFNIKQDTRVFNIGFTYRFSKGKTNGAPRKSGSASDEEKRVKMGN